jgi:hypothetical protein
MSAAESMSSLPLGRERPTGAVLPSAAARVRLSMAELLLAGWLCAALAVGLSYAMGRDLNWDYFNYHGYAAFDVFGRRLAQDFFPAGLQGYLNRLPYLPFALMQAAGWHSAAIGAGLAALASLNALFLYLISREFTFTLPRPRTVAATVAMLGAASNVYLQQLGSTFVDPITTIPVMAAVWLLIRQPDLRALVAAGALCGAAVALKLTNAPFAAGLLAAAMLAQPTGQSAARALAASAAGLACGFLLLYGVWGWRLAQLHGSPLFPVFNNLFRSPDFSAQAVVYHRFVPQSLVDALLLPFRMVEQRSYIYVEGVSPDLRPAVMMLLALAAALLGAWRWRRGAAGSGTVARPWQRSTQRALAVFFGVSLMGWLMTSSNGRYATPLLLLLAPLIFTTASTLVGVRHASLVCLAVLPIQGLLLIDAGNPRWYPTDWAPQWLPASVPASLKEQPQLYVSVSTSSESYVASLVHPDSVFVNPIGLSPIANGGPGWSRFEAMRDSFAGRTKVLFALPKEADAKVRTSRVATMNGAVDRLGLSIDDTKCDLLTFDAPMAGTLRYLWARPDPVEHHTREVLACDAVRVTPSTRLAERRRLAESILDAFERKCPEIFSPNGVQIEGAGTLWSRLYGKFDLTFFVDLDDGQVVYRMQRQAADVIVGQVSTWTKDLERFRCRLPHGGARDLSTLKEDAGR